MDRAASRSRSPGVTASILTLFLILCIAESATGSCLSYGHSCWGAHGKRSGRQPIAAPDWYLTKMLRHIASNSEMNRENQMQTKNDDLSAIFQVEMPEDESATEKSLSENQDTPMAASRTIEAKPMLDDELLSKIKLWQIMRQASMDN
ncbi:unnamed protein product [Diatraea saccharalis]|uniref:Uncharacterized protein n=1 Tax=Diatraea saccharalis TaxID=40085 RepID=A0A9N9WDF0_9NEOP|nr:unnamed protein product [Diatraea saccharalis]